MREGVERGLGGGLTWRKKGAQRYIFRRVQGGISVGGWVKGWGSGRGGGDSRWGLMHACKQATAERHILWKHTLGLVGTRAFVDERRHFTGQEMKSKEKSMGTNTGESGFLESIMEQ